MVLMLMRVPRRSRRTRRRTGPPRSGNGGHLGGGGRGHGGGGGGSGGGGASSSSNPEFRPRDVIMVFLVIPLTILLAGIVAVLVQAILLGHD
jgi:hypothetical protein